MLFDARCVPDLPVESLQGLWEFDGTEVCQSA